MRLTFHYRPEPIVISHELSPHIHLDFRHPPGLRGLITLSAVGSDRTIYRLSERLRARQAEMVDVVIEDQNNQWTMSDVVLMALNAGPLKMTAPDVVPFEISIIAHRFDETDR